jgi:hypothetical protein
MDNLPTGTTRITYNEGAPVSYNIPFDGTITATVEGGGGSSGGGGTAESAGGYVIGTFSVVKDQILGVEVGGAGVAATGGTPGGGNGGVGTNTAGGGGGGFSFIALNKEPLIVAAGGGGGPNGGNGGVTLLQPSPDPNITILTGEDGKGYDKTGATSGGGGSDTGGTAGPSDGTGNDGSAGSDYAGGAGAGGATTDEFGGGGGGGGYYGGGGGASAENNGNEGGGGGGSSYFTSAVTTASYGAGLVAGLNGSVTLKYIPTSLQVGANKIAFTGFPVEISALGAGTVTASVWGAGGGGAGGGGGYITGTFDVKPDDILYVNVGGTNGYNAGGSALPDSGAGYGGGYSSVGIENTFPFLLIAGGGGGGGSGKGGVGGGGGGIPTGEPGGGASGFSGGGGGTQEDGGAGGGSGPGAGAPGGLAGAQSQGGGGGGTLDKGAGAGGGGGGGYWGGGGGQGSNTNANGGGGGGGSSYAAVAVQNPISIAATDSNQAGENDQYWSEANSQNRDGYVVLVYTPAPPPPPTPVLLKVGSNEIPFTGASVAFSASDAGTIAAYVWGAGGGGGATSSASSGDGGNGGFISGTFQVKTGEIITVEVGGSGGLGGKPGFGDGGRSLKGGGSGGGASSISVTNGSLVAGGGGGGGNGPGYNGGNGGFSTTGANTNGSSATDRYGGGGATVTAVGTGGKGIDSNGSDGSGKVGGNGGLTGGGGGGGGYFGGGGGGGDAGVDGGGGGGGSSGALASRTISMRDAPSGAIPTPPAGTGQGGTIGNGGVAGNGYIVLVYTPNSDPVPVVCYAKGTQILTQNGYVKIEDLKASDLVVTTGTITNNHATQAKQSLQPIKWKGHFTVTELTDISRPVCIKAHTFGRNMPFEDLFVSPGHRIAAPRNKRNMLSVVTKKHAIVPAAALINGTSIIQDMTCKEVTYYHIELDKHSMVIANGVPAESYLDVKNRNTFTHVALA